MLYNIPIMQRRSVNGKKQLTRRETTFVENVAAGENQTKAVVKAGYSKKSAKVIGSQLASKTIVQDAIRERKNRAFDANHISAEMVIGALNEIAFAPFDLLFNDDGTADLAAAKRYGLTHLIKKLKLTQTPFGQKAEVEFYSRLEALKELADLGQIRIPQQELENERIRSNFEYAVRVFAGNHGADVETERRKFLAHYERHNPEYFDTLNRLGITAESP